MSMRSNHSTDIGRELKALRQTFAGAWVTQGIAVAAELGLADLLSQGPRTAPELAERTRSHAGSLYRILRALASVGIFAEDPEGHFRLTPLAALLCGDSPVTQRAYAMMMGAEFHAAWGNLLHSARTGKPGFQKQFNRSFFQYLTERPDRHRVFDAAMTAVHGAETQPMLDAYDFGRFRHVVDVGGGNGLLLSALLEQHPHLRGTLFDLPAVVQRAAPALAVPALSKRCRVKSGDFFRAVPRGADAYVLRHVIHDWEDAAAVRILRNCRTAMGRQGRLLVVESVIPPGNAPAFAKWLDLMMLLVGGRERTRDEYAALFQAAGLKLKRLIPTAVEICLLECVRA